MIPLPLQPKVVEKKENRALFQIEGLYPGYGVTVGNAMRRVLLSSLEGAAVTKMKITGVQHEFSTIPGVLEDVIMIMLNLKQLRFRFFAEEPQMATLKVSGEKNVTAADFEMPTQMEIVNKKTLIATLTDKKAKLEMEIQVEKGIGYRPREAKKGEKLAVGEIPLDAIFTPVRKISFKTENMRVGERTDFDRLTLEVETDGTMTPEEAFYRAAEILVSHFSLLSESFQKEAEAASRISDGNAKEKKIRKTGKVKTKKEKSEKIKKTVKKTKSK